MKKILFVLATILTFGVSNVLADNDKIIKKSELPAQAQMFINEYFPGVEITYAKLERDFLERTYEVVLADGTKLEFNGKGEWREVDCRYAEVPAAIVPQPVKAYIKKGYPTEKILKIERDRGNYELKLSNRYELTFNKDFNIVDIDN